jgi:hypothetical protein
MERCIMDVEKIKKLHKLTEEYCRKNNVFEVIPDFSGNEKREYRGNIPFQTLVDVYSPLYDRHERGTVIGYSEEKKRYFVLMDEDNPGRALLPQFSNDQLFLEKEVLYYRVVYCIPEEIDDSVILNARIKGNFTTPIEEVVNPLKDEK